MGWRRVRVGFSARSGALVKIKALFVRRHSRGKLLAVPTDRVMNNARVYICKRLENCFCMQAKLFAFAACTTDIHLETWTAAEDSDGA